MVSKSSMEDAYLHLHGCVASLSIFRYSTVPNLQTSELVSLCLQFSFLSGLNSTLIHSVEIHSNHSAEYVQQLGSLVRWLGGASLITLSLLSVPLHDEFPLSELIFAILFPCWIEFISLSVCGN